MKPYSNEFRGEVLAACDRGRGTREVATYFNVSESWVRRAKQERRELNKVAPCLTRRRTPLWAPLADRMREVIRHKPDLTLRELEAESLLKSASARTVEPLWSVCGDGLDRCTEPECRNCFQHGGYRSMEAGCARGTVLCGGQCQRRTTLVPSDVERIRGCTRPSGPNPTPGYPGTRAWYSR